MHVGIWLPRTKTWTRAGASGATFFAVDAVIETEFFLKVERFVSLFLMLVPDDFMGASDDASSTTGA
jgi:hypothetical protein